VLDAQEGTLEGGLPCLSFGQGPPLVVFPGIGMTNSNPTGIQRWGELRLLSPLARAFTVYRVGRRVGLKSGPTMADLANDYAVALEEKFGRQVDVLGISTGGSIALQLAADRPTMVRKLVVAGAAYRLSEYGREFQRRTAELSAAGDRRGLARMQAPDVTDSRLGRRIAGGLLWLAGPLFIRRGWDPSDMIATIEAEDAFDVGERLGEISAPTLIIGGGRDRFYPAELFRETARRVPNARLVIYEDRAHGGAFADKRFGRDIIAFLKEE
jgi:pimeloyl-ACP methyl ester carboxylesterase